MAAVNISRFNRWLERLLNTKGGPMVVDVDSNAQLNFNYPTGNEDRFLQGWNRFGFSVSVAAVAANVGTFQLRNPAGSNMIAVVESLTFYNATGADQPSLTWGATVTDLTTVASLTFTRIDPRGQPQPTSIISTVAGPSNAAIFRQLSTALGGVAEFIPSVNCEFTVLPGQILKAFSNDSNNAVVFSILWRERALETSEFN